MQFSIDRATLERLCAYYDELAARGLCGIAPDAVFNLRLPLVIGLKYQRVQVAPDLSAVVSSDDGCVVTLRYVEVKEWLAVHKG